MGDILCFYHCIGYAILQCIVHAWLFYEFVLLGMAMGHATRQQTGDAYAELEGPGPGAGRATTMAHWTREHLAV